VAVSTFSEKRSGFSRTSLHNWRCCSVLFSKLSGDSCWPCNSFKYSQTKKTNRSKNHSIRC
jgi:hypothetical protein